MVTTAKFAVYVGTIDGNETTLEKTFRDLMGAWRYVTKICNAEKATDGNYYNSCEFYQIKKV